MSLLNDHKRQLLLGRIDSLRPDSPGQWGSMTISQALDHMNRPILISTGELKVEYVGNIWLANPITMWIVIDSPFPWPRGKIKAPSEIVVEEDVGFESARESLRKSIEGWPENHLHEGALHPAFGSMSADRWGRILYRHCDHHLTQFGV